MEQWTYAAQKSGIYGIDEPKFHVVIEKKVLTCDNLVKGNVSKMNYVTIYVSKNKCTKIMQK